jgi:hypothetical protein
VVCAPQVTKLSRELRQGKLFFKLCDLLGVPFALSLLQLTLKVLSLGDAVVV